MSSNEQELGTTKQDDQKLDTPQEIDTAVQSKDISDSIQKNTEITEKQILDDFTTKPVESNKTSEFGDDDEDFNSDEMQLRWEDDDESNIETPNVKESLNQPEDDLHSKSTTSLETPSTSLVSAVKELENALIETNKDSDFINTKEFKDNDGRAKNECIIEEIETNSKEILDNIDELLGTDDVTEIENAPEHSKISNEAPPEILEPSKSDDPIVKDESKISKMDVDSSAFITKDINETQAVTEVTKPVDSISLDDSTDSIDESNILSSTMNDSFMAGEIKFEHGLKKPDMMLEIPTQEIIECLDDFEDSDSDKSDEKDEGVDISRRTPDGDINSKIMDDEIKSVDEKRDENISEHVITAKDHVEKNPDLIVTDVSTNEDLSDNDVEMCDISKKSDIVLKINEPEKQVAMENSEIIEKENTSEIVPKPVEVTSIADENKDTHVEDTLMEVDEINMPGDELKFLGLDEPSNCNVALKKTEDCVTVKDDSYLSIIEPTGKTDAVINMQATEQDIVTSDKLSIITDMKKIQQTLNIDEVPKKSAPTDNKQETNAHISNEKLEVKDIKLSESRGSNSEMIIIVDKKSECKLPKDSESPANKTAIVMTADSKSSQNEEPSSKSTLDIKSDSDIQNNSNLPNKETTDTPILAQKADLEAPSDSKPPDNVEPMSTESSTVEKTTNCELQNTETTETQILAQNTDSEAQNDSKPSDNVEPMSTESSIVETTNDSVLHSKETTETPILAQNADSEAPKDSIPLDNVKPMSIETSIIEATTNSELQNTETTETPILAQNADSEAPNDSKLSDNLEPISTESPITGTTKPDEKSQKEQSSKAIENITLDQPSTSKESDNTLDQVPDTVDEQQSIKGSENIVPILNQPSSSKEKDNSLGQVPETRDEQKSLKESENIEPLLDHPTTLKDSDNSLDQVPETTDEEQSIKESEHTEPTLDKPSTLKETDNSLDQVPETADESLKESKNIEPISDQLSTSKESDKSLEQVPDTTDEVPEVEDSLGLLAESSRVVEDDEEVEEDEEVDADDDEDFDPDDESSNQMTAEHSEDSSAQPDKDDGQTDKDDKTPTAEEEEFGFNIADVTTADENDMDVITEETKVSDVITSEAAPAPVETVADTDIEKEPDVVEQVADIETVKLSDTSDNETEEATSILKELLTNPDNKPRRFSIQDVPPVNKLSETVVDLEGSSSEDDIQEVNKIKEEEVSSDVKKEEKLIPQNDVKTEAAKSVKKDTEPKEDKATTGGFQTALREKMASLLSKITVMTKPGKPDSSTEVFNLDSDDDVPAVANEVTIYEKPESNKCINPVCPSGARAQYVPADVAARAYFDANKNKKYRVCVACAAAVAERTKGLVNGIKELTPLLQLDLRKVSSETVEISDSDSDDGEGDVKPEILGESGVKFLEENLADVINETWIKYKLDERLSSAQSELDDELRKLEADSKEIDTMLNECQIATDLLRNQLYATFEPERRELSAICIVDTPLEKYSFVENASATPEKNLKRRMSTINEQPAKRPAIPLGYTPLDNDDSKATNVDPSNDDDKDVSVVKLSAEAAPSDLPPPGEISRPVLKTGMSVFAMRNSFCTWLPGKIIDVHPKNPANAFTMCRVRFEIRTKIATRVLSARCLAYLDPADVRLTIGTRVIALSKENAKLDESNKIKKSFYSGIVAEIPNPVNNYRYLIFFDHGYAQYVQHRDTRVVCESSSLVWEEVHPNSREFVKQYLVAYPERPMVRLHAGQRLKTEWNGKWWVTKVLQVDASLVEVSFEDNRTEWIYRGSTRLAPLFLELQAAERQRARPLPRSNQRRMNMPYVEYTRSEEQNRVEAAEQARQQQQSDELRRQRSVAKKSTALPIPAAAPPHPAGPHPNLDGVTSRVVYYTPKNAVKPYKMTTHTCSPSCKRTDVLSLKELRTYNPLAKPLLSGWERQVIRYKGNKEVMYRAPCGRRVRNLKELHDYLRLVQADMGVDLFDFGPNTHCLAEFVLNKCLVGKKDLSHGKENVPVPCVNYYDESLPEFCSYNTERTPTAGVPLNLDPEFLCGCDCTDDCQDKSKCACWKMTLEGARTIGLDHNVGYEYKRLPEPLPSGIYECNSRCKCKHTCLNRVAQHPLQLKLQVFKTLNRGWGIRALNDVPKGAFLCVYAGNLLTDATANLDGLNEGDEYLAELDYIEVVEQMKEGYEEDIPNEDKKLDKKPSESSEEETSSEEEEVTTKDDKEDDDFLPGFIGLGVSEFSKRLRKRDRAKKNEDQKEKEKGKEIDKGMEDDGCITISDDEEAKEPAKFMAQSGIGANGFVSKYKSVRTLYGKDEACYIMDAKVQGNIGRYLNHSCTPNVFVQNVFVDSHDPRFPWVAFFALSHIRAGTELTWNYNYDVGSVPGKVLYCYCGAPNCRGRLL